MMHFLSNVDRNCGKNNRDPALRQTVRLQALSPPPPPPHPLPPFHPPLLLPSLPPKHRITQISSLIRSLVPPLPQHPPAHPIPHHLAREPPPLLCPINHPPYVTSKRRGIVRFPHHQPSGILFLCVWQCSYSPPPAPPHRKFIPAFPRHPGHTPQPPHILCPSHMAPLPNPQALSYNLTPPIPFHPCRICSKCQTSFGQIY